MGAGGVRLVPSLPARVEGAGALVVLATAWSPMAAWHLGCTSTESPRQTMTWGRAGLCGVEQGGHLVAWRQDMRRAGRASACVARKSS
jgi:hypothetical protein